MLALRERKRSAQLLRLTGLLTKRKRREDKGHKEDSEERPTWRLCLDKYHPVLPVLSWLLLACGETLWETLGEPLGETLG